jgi:rhamnosyltransferase
MHLPAPPPRRGNSCALVVSYYPEESLTHLLELLRRIYGAVIVVDNSPEPPKQLLQMEGPTVILNRENRGQAAALNQGFRVAMELGFHWIASFDQDSLPQDEHLAGMRRAHDAHPNKDLIAVIGCNYASGEGETRKVGMPKLEQSESAYYMLPTVITSGSMTKAAAFRSIGGFREDFFIDHVDHEWCLRARSKGLDVIVSPEILMEHGIGELSYHHFMGKRLEASNHSPLRRYYWVRNLTLLARSSIFSDMRYILLLVLYHVPCSIVSILLFESQKMNKLKEMLRGLVHGIIGRLGPHSP